MKAKEYFVICTDTRNAGLYWRENSSGYTRNLSEAGLYTEEDATAIEHLRGQERKVHLTEREEEILILRRNAERIHQSLRRMKIRRAWKQGLTSSPS